MSSVRRRRRVAVGAAAAAAFALTGCATGFGTQTNQQYQAGIGADERDSSVYVLGALFVDNGNDTATLSASLINQRNAPEQLTSVETTTRSGQPLTSTFAGPADLAMAKPYVPGTSGDIVLTGNFTDGGNVKITFNFDKAAPVTISVPVVRRTAMYDSVATGSPTPTPTGPTPAESTPAA